MWSFQCGVCSVELILSISKRIVHDKNCTLNTAHSTLPTQHSTLNTPYAALHSHVIK